MSVYAVKLNTDPDNPQEVASMGEDKLQILIGVFWDMNEISFRTESYTETVIVTTVDDEGALVETETTVTRTRLYITVTHKTAEKMADEYGFSTGQREQLADLLSDENASLWSAALYGIDFSGDIVHVKEYFILRNQKQSVEIKSFYRETYCSMFPHEKCIHLRF